MTISSTSISSSEAKSEAKYISNVWNDVNYAINLAKADQKQYNRYKDDKRIVNNEPIDELSDYQIKEIKTISILERLGFSLDEVGTYLYKELIMNVFSDIDKCGTNLKDELNNRYSSYYQQIAREYYEMGVTTFHNYIVSAINNMDGSQVDESLVKTIFGDDIDGSSYGTRAYEIASYMVRIEKSKKHDTVLEKK
jgi:DNA-binding transcriptional MerR regulator